MTDEATFQKVIAKVREQLPEPKVLAYLKKLESENKYRGVVAHYQKNGAAEPEINLDDISSSPPAKRGNIPPAVQAKLAEIAAKFKQDITVIQDKWHANMADPDLVAMADSEQEAQTEAWQWIVMELTHEMTMGGQKAEWTFTLWSRDSEVGSWDKWVKKPGQNDPKNQISIPTGVASGFGLFTRENDDGTKTIVADSIASFDDEGAAALVALKPLVTYNGEIEKGKKGFTINGATEFTAIGTEEKESFARMLRKVAKEKAIQPTELDGMKFGKKAKNFILDCRILHATQTVLEESNTEMATLKVIPSDMDSIGEEPKAYYITFWRDSTVMAFEYGKNSRVLVGVSAKHSDDYVYNLTGRWVLPVRVIKQDDPGMVNYSPPSE